MRSASERFPQVLTQSMPPRRRYDGLLSFLLLAGSLCVCALAGELVLRLLGHGGAPEQAIKNIHPVDDPVLDWRYVPNSRLRVGNVVYAYNESGFRDVDHAVEKPAGIARIVVLGDSVTEGGGVEWESVFCRAVQSRLGAAFELINIAAGGLNTPQEVHLLRQEGIRYKPDLVILNFVLNDVDFYTNFKGAQRYLAAKDSRIGILNLPVNPEFKQLLKSSALIYYVKERVEDLKGRLAGRDETDYYTRIWASEENRQKVTTGFDQLAALAKEKEFDLVVIIWPVLMDYRYYRFGALHEWVKSQAEKRGIAAIDLLPAFSQIKYRRLQVTAEDNVHPNALGHKIAAEAFLTWFDTRGLRRRW